jgi:hypothetical protein
MILKLNKIRIIAIIWLIFLPAFLLGFCVGYAKIWPYSVLTEAVLFIEGGQGENLSLWKKFTNDFASKPTRHIAAYSIKKSTNMAPYKALTELKLNPRRNFPEYAFSEKAPDGYRVIYGVFDFRQGLHGAIMLDNQGRVVHVWHFSQERLDWKSPKDTNVFPHGFEIARDGSIVTAYDGGTSLTKYDYCGNVLWRLKGGFHHSIAFEGDGAVWVWGDSDGTLPYGNHLLKIDYNTGQIIKEIPLQKVMDTNTDIDIFGILQKDTSQGSEWYHDHWHPNDIDPLPKRLERFYPMFRAGDLLVSLRSPNLVFVMDQDTLKVKWWRQGLARRQHDPDWNDKGTITIFNNNMHRGYSNILELNPVTFDNQILLDGKSYGFRTYRRGKHQLMPNGGLLITSSEQGRVFETDREGNLTFEFLNSYNGNQENLVISEAVFLPKDYFTGLPECK